LSNPDSLGKGKLVQYYLSFKVTPNLPDHSQSYLPEHIRFDFPDRLVICLHQGQDETNKALKSRAEWEIDRELMRINVLEDILFESRYMSSEPLLTFGFSGTPSTGWGHHPIDPKLAKSQGCWNSKIETKLVLWEKVKRETSTPALIYAYLYMNSVLHFNDNSWKDWKYKSTDKPTPFQEINILRNLLLHNGKANDCVIKYLEIHGIDHERNVKNSQIHTKHASDRLANLLSAVWKTLLIDLGYGDSNS